MLKIGESSGTIDDKKQIIVDGKLKMAAKEIRRSYRFKGKEDADRTTLSMKIVELKNSIQVPLLLLVLFPLF